MSKFYFVIFIKKKIYSNNIQNMNIFLLFPIHLFSDIKNLKNKNLKVYLLEEPRYFNDFKYHKLKLAYHRATMKSYYDYLKKNNIDITYVNFNEITIDFYKNLQNKIIMYDPNDYKLQKKIQSQIKSNLEIIETLNFTINRKLIIDNIHKFSKNNKYNHKQFYKWQRIRLNILMNGSKPIGNKWSFDKENRKKIPNGIDIPSINTNINRNSIKYINEAKEYVNANFSENYGSLNNFIYPVNHSESIEWLKDFLKHRFNNFGIYEDAETSNDPFLFHSVLTPMMNIGLLTDNEVLDITLKYNDIPISSMEGFIRQIIGWRNYMYAIYLLEGEKIPNMNFFNHKNIISYEMMLNAKTYILPIDNIVNKINEYGYAHHIERLMYLGNFLLLCMIDPNQIYKLFMEWTIDAYDWVMIPNVYSMSQFVDGGMVMTKPYFSSSNYILKMSNYKKDKWTTIWDALYYNFIFTHKDYLSKNYGTARQVYHWNNKSESEKLNLIKRANDYLSLILD
jgi:deoxyribodipyrimidine photolyase-related protein